jgi:hypothetical protein
LEIRDLPDTQTLTPNPSPLTPTLRICPVDWEVAAIGATLCDFAFFADGFEPPMLDRLWDAYRQEAAQYGIPLPDERDMPYILDCFCLHRTITLLSKSFEENFPESGVVKLLDRAEVLKRCLRRGSASATSL